ncbi:segregation and condensation protein A [Hyphomonas neptunium ATCC 15444]|uniref:Segregation and condensation protein A n=2 Tax=Hyphomonas TaxID=85 RepID=Q0C0J8_HYPNA|nr:MULTISPECIES: ScpA family protein [Hyphomonas]ABI76202.1 segregation and condensation protein A [Hyphomonas neptunium ATCC 15444]KCZ87559.1 segregation and condensation protein A [Hyphomonas hirschiana VP5]
MSSDTISIDALSAGAEDAEGVNIFNVEIGGYEGPLHLLLELARRQKVNLLQISMLRLAEQYLSFVEDARTKRIDIAADYLLMASWLAFMKSRLLLPKPEAIEEDEPTGEEMAARLAFRLKRLDAMRQAVRELEAGPVLDRVVFLRGETEQPKVVKHMEYTASLYDLSTALGTIRDRREKERPHRIEQQLVLPLEQARTTLRGLREQLDQWASLADIRTAMTDINPEVPERSVTASVFSAALELTRDGEVDLRQDTHFAPIYMRRIAVRPSEMADAVA